MTTNLPQQEIHPPVLPHLAAEYLNALTPQAFAQSILGSRQLPPVCPFPQSMLDGPRRYASVLVPLVRIDEEWHLLFIRRTEREGDRHSGQVAFAGGKAEPDDTSAIHTAIREAEEEIGILASQVSVLGQLQAHFSLSNFLITPVVAVLEWPVPLTLQPSEVASTFTIPLAWLANPLNREQREHTVKPDINLSVTYFEHYQNELLWGTTARVTISLLAQLVAAQHD